MKNSTSGISFFGLLTVVFIGLKLAGAITWSWFWVLSPLFLPLLILFTASFIAAVVLYILEYDDDDLE